MLNADGSVIGIDTAGSLNTASGASATWGCAIPITRAMTIAQQIRSGTQSPYIESGHRGVLGVVVRHRAGIGGTAVLTSPRRGCGSTAAQAGDVITPSRASASASVADLNQVMQDRRPSDDSP